MSPITVIVNSDADALQLTGYVSRRYPSAPITVTTRGPLASALHRLTLGSRVDTSGATDALRADMLASECADYLRHLDRLTAIAR